MARASSLSTALLFLLAGPVSADLFVSAGAGAFDPWKGSAGYEIEATVLTTLGKKQSWRLGGEFSFRAAEFEIQNAKSVDFGSYRLSFVPHVRSTATKLASAEPESLGSTSRSETDSRSTVRLRSVPMLHGSTRRTMTDKESLPSPGGSVA